MFKVRELESCERALCDAVSIKDGISNAPVTVFTKAELIVSHWGQSDVLLVERPVPVPKMISPARVSRQRCHIREVPSIAIRNPYFLLIGMNEIAMPRRKRSVLISFPKHE